MRSSVLPRFSSRSRSVAPICGMTIYGERLCCQSWRGLVAMFESVPNCTST